ncbi:MAG: OsmC family peroxiredoxin [Thermomicrobiales bacterium]|nr:OsmC family peroxiredoxin [Thermomicrobiales bacterium]
MATRKATTVWTGDLHNGGGVVSGETGALGEQKITLPTRVGDANGGTSPEELLAASHSGCLAMNLSATLTNNGTPPEELTVTSDVGFGPKDGGGFKITHANVTISGKVPGLTAEQFESLATTAEQTCPISNAIRGNVPINVEISFEG